MRREVTSTNEQSSAFPLILRVLRVSQFLAQDTMSPNQRFARPSRT